MTVQAGKRQWVMLQFFKTYPLNLQPHLLKQAVVRFGMPGHPDRIRNARPPYPLFQTTA